MFRFGTCPRESRFFPIATSTAETEFDPAFTTSMRLLSGVNVSQSGWSPTWTPRAASTRHGIHVHDAVHFAVHLTSAIGKRRFRETARPANLGAFSGRISGSVIR
jgi:hypothetical protein